MVKTSDVKTSTITRSFYKHYCQDWDFLEIDGNNIEIIACNCFLEDDTLEKIKEEHNIELEKLNEK